jgi:hypothetical protein
MTTEQSTHTALRRFAQIKATGDDCLIISRDDHPHISGTYFYAIRPSDKHAWTSGESPAAPRTTCEPSDEGAPRRRQGGSGASRAGRSDPRSTRSRVVASRDRQGCGTVP